MASASRGLTWPSGISGTILIVIQLDPFSQYRGRHPLGHGAGAPDIRITCDCQVRLGAQPCFEIAHLSAADQKLTLDFVCQRKL